MGPRRRAAIAHAMRAGSLAVACLADVPDWPVLGRMVPLTQKGMREP